MATKKSTTKAKANDDMPIIETPEPPPIPAGARKPQDRKRKAEDGPTSMTVTVRGVKFTLQSDALDDFELLDDLDELENGNPGRMPRILKRLTGDSYKELLDTIRDEDGRVRIEDGGRLVNDVLEALDPNS